MALGAVKLRPGSSGAERTHEKRRAHSRGAVGEFLAGVARDRALQTDPDVTWPTEESTRSEVLRAHTVLRASSSCPCQLLMRPRPMKDPSAALAPLLRDDGHMRVLLTTPYHSMKTCQRRGHSACVSLLLPSQEGRFEHARSAREAPVTSHSRMTWGPPTCDHPPFASVMSVGT